jgi:hypothetical protein
VTTGISANTKLHAAIGEEAVLNEIISADLHCSSCHKCGKPALHNWFFGLGKVISVRRAWGDSAIAAAVSAVTLPLIGAGALRFPGKKTSFQVLRLQLRLCDSCVRRKDSAYSIHPAWQRAAALGYTEFFDGAELKKLQITR